MQIIDRRLNPRGKSLENRQRFLRRAKTLVQQAVTRSFQQRDIQDVLEGGEVKIPLNGIDEPRLHRGPGGVRDQVLPGNKEFIEGDVLRRSSEDGRTSQDVGEGVSEDEFRFVLTREEFVDLFLDDLELPDLTKRRVAETDVEAPRRVGYSVSGSPANLAISRTMRLAMARRVALGRPKAETIQDLQVRLGECSDEDRRSALALTIESLRSKLRRIPYIDPVDIRYRRFENEPKPIAQAVMFCLMDVSSSMSEHMKDLAKRFYMLLYIFLTRRYSRVELVFVRHTERAEEVDEETFFRGPVSGGTMVSSAFEAMREIISARYPAVDWNIYAAQASDGDNAYTDAAATERLLQDSILPICQYFAYIEVGDDGSAAVPHSALWTQYQRLCSKGASLSMRKVNRRSEIFPVFQELFRRRQGS
jgi:uncharacterized sporulation protein YeaH/YhbH (DUF444 family)